MTLQVFSKAGGCGEEPLELFGDPTRVLHRGYDEADDRSWRAVPGRSPSAWERWDRASRPAAAASASSSRSRASRPTVRAGARAGLISNRRPARSFRKCACSTAWLSR